MIKKKVSVFRKKHVPPTMKLMDEAGIFANNDDVYLKQIFKDKGFIKEIRDIADETLGTYHYCDNKDNNKCQTGFNITLSGSLDILDPCVAYSSLECKCNETTNIARTVGLFADKLFITDHLSAYLSNYNKGAFNLNDITLMTSSVNILAPLIDNKIIEFRTPLSHYCKECAKKIVNKMMSSLDSILDYDKKIEVSYLGQEKRHHVILMGSPLLERLFGFYGLETSITNADFIRLFPKKKFKILVKIKEEPLRSIIKEYFKDKIKDVMHGLASANKTSSLFMSKSKYDTIFLSSLDKVHIKHNDIDQWEAMRSIDLPWIGQLDINQIIRLREEAYLSLESLRNHLTLGFMQGGKQKVTDIVAELTAKIPELKQEILAKEIVKKSHNKYAFELGSMGISLVIYGLASSVPVAAVGSVAAFLASICHLHEGALETKKRETNIITSPAYALLKAGDLLSCQEKK